MNTWLKFLPIEIQDVTELIEPIDEIKEGETIIGTISDELKGLWTLAKTGRKAAELLEVELRYTPVANQDRTKVNELASKARATEVIFWVGVFDEFKLWGHQEQCGLRVGWQVVEFKMPESPFFKLFPGSIQ